MAEIKYSEKKKEYTLEDEVDGEKTIKRVPIKFKHKDSTARFRKETLKKELDQE